MWPLKQFKPSDRLDSATSFKLATKQFVFSVSNIHVICISVKSCVNVYSVAPWGVYRLCVMHPSLGALLNHLLSYLTYITSLLKAAPRQVPSLIRWHCACMKSHLKRCSTQRCLPAPPVDSAPQLDDTGLKVVVFSMPKKYANSKWLVKRVYSDEPPLLKST